LSTQVKIIKKRIRIEVEEDKKRMLSINGLETSRNGGFPAFFYKKNGLYSVSVEPDSKKTNYMDSSISMNSCRVIPRSRIMFFTTNSGSGST
jgi:hypothetical protein